MTKRKLPEAKWQNGWRCGLCGNVTLEFRNCRQERCLGCGMDDSFTLLKVYRPTKETK